ncbi:hypothetical protein [Hansschlegelia zhihuaiae]|uniref:DUF2188 domain-containing protein n=1 Tax=Hansschlegelia zhihuaiae TaxID=405005 RepID=A0A4Q0M4P3_9HYPH|nr:hypothetical protein [Hansschlegelia zhihuaiae]RXF67948.1 hypothetical protein EK403_20705 [Hansschlegelia zhihuaiae]
MSDEPEIIEKDGSWSYRFGGMTFGSYPSREAALIASAKHQGEHPEPVEGQDDSPRDQDNPTPS